MTIRTSSKTITFRHPFWLKGVDHELPPRDYRVVTDEELIEGSVVSCIPSRIDGDLRAGAVKARATRAASRLTVDVW